MEGPAQSPVAAVIVYRTLGELLPERYDPDRRSLRCTTTPQLHLIQLHFNERFFNTLSKTLRKREIYTCQSIKLSVYIIIFIDLKYAYSININSLTQID